MGNEIDWSDLIRQMEERQAQEQALVKRRERIEKLIACTLMAAALAGIAYIHYGP